MSGLRHTMKPIASVLTGLARASLLPLLDRSVPSAGVIVRRDLAYGSRERQRLDLYIPERLARPAPVLLFFYGGSWQSGSKNLYGAFGRLFARAGLITAIADYRLYPEVRYPSFVEDGACAVGYLRSHIDEADPSQLFVSGHSAGAYIAVMLGVNPVYLRALGGEVSWIKGIVGIAGPYDFLPLQDPALIDIFGGPREMTTQPIKYAANAAPAMMLAHGLSDRTVGAGNSQRMARRLLSAGNKVELKGYGGVGHIEIMLSLLPPLRSRTSLYDDMLRFLGVRRTGLGGA